MKSEVNCAILSMYPFPIGMAATNRILAYSKGLIENGANVDVFIPIPTHRPSKIEMYGDEGIYEGIRYFYTIGRFSNSYKIIRSISILSGYRKIVGFVNTSYKISENHRLRKYDCLIISTDKLLSLWFYSNLASYLGQKSVFIFDEYPVPIRHKLKDRIPVWKTFFYSRILKKTSAYISISEELKLYYNSLCKKDTLILPVITDTSRFTKKTTVKNMDSKYICYMGNMELAKDNVNIIIEAFALISTRYADIELHLYGTPNDHDNKILKNLITTLKLTNRVYLKGKVESNLVPNILMNAKLLVSSQPDTLRASGGFPTKLGEYLASGVPALLTDVGENKRYVKDKVHVYLTKPNNPEEYAKNLAFILDNYDIACNVARIGKEHLKENYSHTAMGKRMKDFIININKK